MTLAPGAELGPYEVVAPVGAGGMGEVYRARDAKLGRDVAIKVLPAEFALDPDRLARFEREARVLASLNHPNIAQVYSFERMPAPTPGPGLPGEASIAFLVMEFVLGEDLSQRLKSGAIPVEEAVAIARQIAEGLEEAHEKGIVHRDLKPANIKLTPDGRVKVLDFGLAKAYAAEATGGSAPEVSHSPTLTRQGTEAGMILGTAAYMSPEQARGKALDRRTDIWSFGVLLYEMLSGKRLFAGDTVSDVIAAVLRADPDWSALSGSVSTDLRRLLARCLERDPRNRFHDIADVRLALADARLRPEEPGAPIPGASRAVLGRALPWLIAAVAVVGAIVLSMGRRADGTSRSPTVFGILVPEGRFLTRLQSPILDIGRDGRTLLFVAEGKEPSSVFRRLADRRSIQRIEGTEGAEHPVVSADGRWVAFFSGGKLRKAPIEGGASVEVADALAPGGLAVAPDGSIVFSPTYTSALFRIAAAGGGAAAITRLDEGKERSHRWPQVLPDGRTAIFTVGAADSPGNYDGANIDAVNLETGERRTILKGARMARYTSLGYLVFQRGETLLAAPFDPGKLEVTGESFAILEGVSGDPTSGSGYFAVSDQGVIVLTPEASIPKNRALVPVDASGKETPLAVDAASFFQPGISPDGRRITYAIGTGSAADDDVFVFDLATSRPQRLTFGLGHGMPIWTPDGRKIAYTKGRSGNLGVATRAADGSGEETRRPRRPANSSCSKDGSSPIRRGASPGRDGEGGRASRRRRAELIGR